MPLHIQGVVKRMCRLSMNTARKHEFVTARLLALRLGMLHQGTTYSAALMPGRNSHIFHHPGASPMLGKIVHDEQFIGANNLLFECCNKDVIVRVLRKDDEMFLSFFRRERFLRLNSCILVEQENLSHVISSRFADE